MTINNTQGVKMFCAILLIVYIPMLIGSCYNIAANFLNPGYKDTVIKTFGEPAYYLGSMMLPIAAIILLFLTLGTIMTLRFLSLGRVLLLIFSIIGLCFDFIYSSLFMWVSSSYWRFAVVSSWAKVPQLTFIIAIFTVYYMTRPEIKEQFKS